MSKGRRGAIWRSMDRRIFGDFAVQPGWKVQRPAVIGFAFANERFFPTMMLRFSTIIPQL